MTYFRKIYKVIVARLNALVSITALLALMSAFSAEAQTFMDYKVPDGYDLAEASVDRSTATEASTATTLPDLVDYYGSPGLVVSGSVGYQALPGKARKFLARHCDGHAVTLLEKEYTSGNFHLQLADGIAMTFDPKGKLTNVEAPENYSLSPTFLKAVVPSKLYNLLDHNGFERCVEGVHLTSGGYRLDVADPVFHQINYDATGVLTMIVD